MPETTPLNPRAVPGSNQAPDYAQQVTDRIAEEYREIATTLDRLLDEARDMPTAVYDDQTALLLGGLIKKMRDVDGRIEAVRVLEKEPYLRGGNAVDSFFNAMRDKIGRRVRTAKAGAIDILQARINDYQERKIAAERSAREAEARERERIAREAAARAAREAAEAAEKAAAADRARKAETIAARQREAEAAQQVADREAAEAKRAAEIAEEARLATLAKPADVARVRGNDDSGAGVTLTVAKEPYAILTDRAKVNLDLLRPYFTDAEIEKALRGWAKANGHRIAMDGAEIGFRNKGVTR